ncbi:Phosphatidylinositol 4-kinase pik1alpha (PI4-kinase)(PtdIns-4-kinase), partial [Nowakowskiella sp. JEL0078]
MSAMLASVSVPSIVNEVRDMVLMEGRNDYTLASDLTPQEENHDGPSGWMDDQSNASSLSDDLEHTPNKHVRALSNEELNARIPSGPTLEDLHKGSAFSFSRYSQKAKNTFDLNTTEDSHLVHSHYSHSELEFIMALVNIGDRLRSVPKEARQSSLVAELSLLNHNLPADVCVPLWCKATATDPHHHKVLRISPNDCVVLNSADRVPYLVCIELLENPHWVDADKNDHLIDDAPQTIPDLLNGIIDLHIIESSRKSDRSESPLDDRNSPNLNAEEQPYDFDITKNSKNSSTLAKLDYFSERMRTAAVMMAQLYQQQQKEIEAIKTGNSTATLLSQNTATQLTSVSTQSPPPIPRSASTNLKPQTILSASNSINPKPEGENSQPTEFSSLPAVNSEKKPSIPISKTNSHKQTNSAPSSPRPSTTANSHVTVSSPPSVRSDRRKYQKLKQNFEEIRQRLIKEMLSLESQRMQLQKSLTKEMQLEQQSKAQEQALEYQKLLKENFIKLDKEDPSAAVFRETWDIKQNRIKNSSPYGSKKNWTLVSVIVKSGADLRQEQLALQLIKEFKKIWSEASVPVWIHSFKILVTSSQSGLIETIKNAVSIHSIKKGMSPKSISDNEHQISLYNYFLQEFGSGHEFRAAQDNFMRSLAGYSVICYVLQIKDRHNGNILLDNSGHMIHIDFGFMLSNSPGSMGFELAPFKLPQEYIDILGGHSSPKFQEFRSLMKEAFLALRKKSEAILNLVEMMETDSFLPCFTGAASKPSTVYIPPTASSFLPSFSTFSATTPPMTTTEGHPHEVVNGHVIATASSVASTGHVVNASRFPVTMALKERFHLGLGDGQLSELVDRLVDS